MSEHYTSNHNPDFWKADNDDLFSVNCGSYALDVIEWYRPYDEYEENGDDIICQWDGFGTFGEALEDSTICHVNNILKDFDDIRIINSIEEVSDKERLILYREGIFSNNTLPAQDSICDYEYKWDWDFHFIWRDVNQKWHEKKGACRIQDIDKPSMEKPWYGTENIYQGPIIMLAKKEKFELV